MKKLKAFVPLHREITHARLCDSGTAARGKLRCIVGN